MSQPGGIPLGRRWLARSFPKNLIMEEADERSQFFDR